MLLMRAPLFLRALHLSPTAPVLPTASVHAHTFSLYILISRLWCPLPQSESPPVACSVEVSPSQIDFGKPQTSLERQRLYHSTKHMLVPFCAPKACSSNSLNAIAAADIQWQCKSTLNRDCTIKRFYGCAAHEWRPPVV